MELTIFYGGNIFNWFIRLFFCLAILSCGPISYTTSEDLNSGLSEEILPIPPSGIYYQSDIESLLHSRCVSCHNSQSSGRVRLDSYNLMFAQKTHRNSEEPFDKLVDLVSIGDKSISGLYLSISTEDLHSKILEGTMPPENKLAIHEIKRIGEWIDQGALFGPRN